LPSGRCKVRYLPGVWALTVSNRSRVHDRVQNNTLGLCSYLPPYTSRRPLNVGRCDAAPRRFQSQGEHRENARPLVPAVSQAAVAIGSKPQPNRPFHGPGWRQRTAISCRQYLTELTIQFSDTTRSQSGPEGVGNRQPRADPGPLIIRIHIGPLPAS
jgi:hypothetical protein